MELSILIPVFGKWNFTASCLKDLSHLDPKKTEIIVVDNASTDNTLEELQKLQTHMSNLKIINNVVNTGFGNASNQAYNISSGRYIMFLNNDIRVKCNHNSWAFDLSQHCTDTNLVGPTGGKIDPNNDFQFMYETNDPVKDINYLSGWCMIGKKSVWEQLIEPTNTSRGPFWNDLFCYYEDTDLSFRARQKNIDLQLVAIPVVHFGKTSSKQLNVYELYTKSRAIFTKRWKAK